jgi:hypothetical protein
MLKFSGLTAGAPEFIPSPESRDWIADGIVELSEKLGPITRQPRLLTEAGKMPRDLDGLFELICSVQASVGQSEVELTLLELDARGSNPNLPADYESLGDSEGKLLHTLRGPDEYLILFTPAVFKVRELLFASVARELGRVALDRAGLRPELDAGEGRNAEASAALRGWEADAEIAAILLGMGIWVVNGSYMFENACCGGGCGVDLRSLRTGLSMPEASYAFALDSQRKGLGRWQTTRHLSPTQKAATKQSWSLVASATPKALAAAAPEVRGQLR